jgi:hypothetical protein
MERVVKGYQDGFVFIVKMYETSNPRGLLNDYFDISHYSKANKREINISGWKGVEYLRKEDALYHNIQCFATKRRVYVIEVAGRSEANPAINKFLSSLKLGAAASGPNSAFSVVDNSPGQNSTTLASTPVTNRAFDKSEVTHQAVLLYLPIPVRPNGFRGAVRLKMVLSASGEVTDISVAKGPNPIVSQYLTNLARFIIFLPAEKDGRPVSQSSEATFNFQ